MSGIDSQTILQREMLGKGTKRVYVTGDPGVLTGLDYYMVHFPITTTVSTLAFATDNCTITAGGQTLISATTYPAGTTIHARITGIGITSGIAICYQEHDGDITA